MTFDRPNQRSPHDARESLPADFEPSLREVDRLLARSLGGDEVAPPNGMAQRIFEMTAPMLTAERVANGDAPSLRLVEAEVLTHASPRRLLIGSWARLAMAASVLVVAGVALWMTWPKTPAQGPIASTNNNSRGGAPNIVRAAINLDDLNTLDADNPSSLENLQNEFAYLLDASEVRSFDDLNDDLLLLVQQLEM